MKVQRALMLAAVAALCALALGAWAEPLGKCDLELGREYIPEDEPLRIQEVVQLISRKMDATYQGKAMARGAHPKAHGCVAARFVVDTEHLDATTRQKVSAGVFAEHGRTFPAWLRFSNGNPDAARDDHAKDVRAISIKLMGVEGDKIFASQYGLPREEQNTQDFILMTYPQFFVRNAASYVPLTELMSANLESFTDYLKLARSVLSFAWDSMTQSFKNVKILYGVLQQGGAMQNPLSAEYWSTTPYKLGPSTEYSTKVENAVKYHVRPCADRPAPAQTPKTDSYNYLRDNMQKTLSSQDVCLEFMVQLQLDACQQPIEDPTVLWDADKTPFVRVARIEIPQQHFNSVDVDEMCENLTYTPFHSLPQHRPLGGVNRPRKDVYMASTLKRHLHNNVPRVEPTSQDPLFTRVISDL